MKKAGAAAVQEKGWAAWLNEDNLVRKPMYMKRLLPDESKRGYGRLS